MGVEVSKTGIDWVDKQLKAELDKLQASKFDKDKAITYLNTVKNAKSYRDMMKNNSTVTIMAVQILLKELGYNIGKVDGILKTKGKSTSNTMEAIKDFQEKNGLTPDRAPGPFTVRKLLEKFGNGSANTPKPATPNNPKPATPNNPKPKTPERQAQSAEATLADLKNFNPYSVGNFGRNGFVFNKGVEKSDSKGKYILVNGKKLYELGNNKSGVHYDKYKSDDGSWTAIVFGEYKNGERNGRGKAAYSDGRKYDGEWKNDKREGQGTYTWPDGHKYAGEWKNGKREGKGTGTWPDGRKYDGEWKNDKREGQGTYTWPDGGKYDGEWKNDKREGQGTCTGPNGTKYAGEWKNDDIEGKGTGTWPNGDKFIGLWKSYKIWSGVKYSKYGKILERWINGKKFGG